MYMISPITSYAIGAFGERAVKALYDLSYKGILR